MTGLAAPIDGGTSPPRDPHHVQDESSAAEETFSARRHRWLTASDALRIVLVSAAGALLASGISDGLGHPRLFGLAVLLGGGYPIFKTAFENVLERRMTMELSMTIALRDRRA